MALINVVALIKSLFKTPQLLQVNPRISLFLLKYFAKFKIKKVGDAYILHSHLPPLNSSAYTKFVTKHLVEKFAGPTHAQIGLTNACPQNCAYCYNKIRSGKPMDTSTIITTIKDLGGMGVAWLGLTGGEPLLNKDIVEIIDRTDKKICLKLFTTGCRLTKQKALAMKSAGLTYVSVSLDSDQEEPHDAIRGYKGAFIDAIQAIHIFLEAGLHASVSAVLTKEMMQKERLHMFIGFLENLGIHEAWLSEAKPSTPYSWNDTCIITDRERADLMNYQDAYNKKGKLTFNYLGHFEHGCYFGCNAGRKMIYVDAFGEVSPCVFTPMTFGNVSTKPVSEIYAEMKEHFKPQKNCFINANYKLFKKHYQGISPIPQEDAIKIVSESASSGIPEFNRIQDLS